MKFSALLLIYLIGAEASKRPSGSTADKHRKYEGSRNVIGIDHLEQSIGNPTEVHHGNIDLHPLKNGHFRLKPGGDGNGAKSGEVIGEAVEQSNSTPHGSSISTESEIGFSKTQKKDSKKRDKWVLLEKSSEPFSGKSRRSSMGQRRYSNYGNRAGQGRQIDGVFGKSNVQGQYVGSSQAADRSGLLGNKYGQSNVQRQFLGSGQVADQGSQLGTEVGHSNDRDLYVGSGQAIDQGRLFGAAFDERNVQGQHLGSGQAAGQRGLLRAEFGQNNVQSKYLRSVKATGQNGLIESIPSNFREQYLGSGQSGLLGAAFGPSNVQGQNLGLGQDAGQSGQLRVPNGNMRPYLVSGQGAGQSELRENEFGQSNVQGQYFGSNQAAGQSGLFGNYGYQSSGQSGSQGGLLGSLSGPSIIQGQYFGQSGYGAPPPGISGLGIGGSAQPANLPQHPVVAAPGISGLGIRGSAQLQYPGVLGQSGSYYGGAPVHVDRQGLSNGQSHIIAQQGFIPTVSYGTTAGRAQAAYSGLYSAQASGYNYGGVNAPGQNGLLGQTSTAQGLYTDVANPTGYLGTGSNTIMGLGGQSRAPSLWNEFTGAGGVGQISNAANGTDLPLQPGQNSCSFGQTINGQCVLANGLTTGYQEASSSQFIANDGGSFQKPALRAVGRYIAPGFYYPPPQHLKQDPNIWDPVYRYFFALDRHPQEVPEDSLKSQLNTADGNTFPISNSQA